MSPLVIQLVASLITAGPQLLDAVAALVRAAHGETLTEAEHQALGQAVAHVAQQPSGG